MNFEKLKESMKTRLDEIENRGNKFAEAFLQIKEGTTTIRLLPPKDEDSPLWAETRIHRIPQGENIKAVQCLKIFDKPCPICDLYYALWKTGSTRDSDLAKAIKGRARYYLNVVERDSNKVKIWSIGEKLFQKVATTMLDDDYGNIVDLEKGHDFKIVMVKDGKWPDYSQSAPRPKPSPAGNKKEIDEYMNSLHDINTLVKEEDYEEVKTITETLMAEHSMGMPGSDKSSQEEMSQEEYIEKLKEANK